MSTPADAARDGERVRCRYCGKTPLVLSDGTVRAHDIRKGRRCPGWGQFKEQVDADLASDTGGRADG